MDKCLLEYINFNIYEFYIFLKKYILINYNNISSIINIKYLYIFII